MQCRFYVVVWQSWGLVCKQAAWWWKRLCSGALAFTGDVLRWSTSFHDPFFSAPGPSAILAHTHNTDFLHSNPCYLKALISTFQPAGLQGLFEGGGCCTLFGIQVTVTHFLLSQCCPQESYDPTYVHMGAQAVTFVSADLGETLPSSLSHWWCMQALRLCEEHHGDALWFKIWPVSSMSRIW